ncbi:MAG: hypothetical protein COU83_00875 [Candidatus Portnoybacteria bacterium CG10_big_fil_rev_8_21_14_0_10_40_22]|uniref:UDP-N-acetylglucosamine--N-acetylmuramyl-(pentapeptide) pyrophosphoryl-undecaprenol N-acetylglucosamine transferase n=1 Tax=Candidatus Portnoybacteria bacterium CG10_big_fil_rev_8_21_14_0_10_40_22 TaxID=1974814 RepID=A0A2M8KGB6_9BACT|nr:MAG: hypothetical protein COU83_00875 [Candidatus Portnoybacteria bacterium CG10_big_fil_rev_8_21_14_0_10_40_22]
MRVLLTGGGTGGHTYPLIAVSQQLKLISQQNNFPLELFYLGVDGSSQKGLSSIGAKPYFIFSLKLRRYFSIKTIWDFIKAPFGFCQILFWLYSLMPDVIFSKGGPASFFVVLAGWFYRIPVIIHESDTVAGLNNRLSARFAKKVFIAFDGAKSYFPLKKTITVGNPLRQGIFQIDQASTHSLFKIQAATPVLLIAGGSQGAQFINEKIKPILMELSQKYQVIHICGQDNYEAYQGQISQEKGLNLTSYHLYGSLDESQMSAAYAIANLVVARSGAGTIFELAYLAKPAILIPLPDAAGDHQKINAYDYSQNGAAVVLEQPNLTENILLQRITALLDDPQRLILMAQAAKQFAKPEAALKIAQEILQYAT